MWDSIPHVWYTIPFAVYSFIPLLSLYNARKKYGKQKPSRTSDPRTEDTVPVRSNFLPSSGNIDSGSNHLIQSRQTDIRSFGTNINTNKTSPPTSIIHNSPFFQFDNLQSSGMSRLLSDDDSHSDLILGIAGLKSCLLVGQLINANGRRTIWTNGASRISTAEGVTKLFIVSSDCREVLMNLTLTSTSGLNRRNCIKFLRECPVKSANRANLDEAYADAMMPMAILTCHYFKIFFKKISIGNLFL